MEQQRPLEQQPLLTLGRYALFGEIARGGMAAVHFGRMSSLGGFARTVAIKRMRGDIAQDPEFIAAFLDEGRLAARVEHPNVVTTLDVVAEAGEVFLVMEYVRGESLAKLLRLANLRGEKVPVPVALSILCGALYGLQAAHEAVSDGGAPLGMIHRDVSPQNILVGEDGIARITDFGIAKAEFRLQVTLEGQIKGKLGYMAPEQFANRGAPVDRRVDLFTAATVLWETLAGTKLFVANSPSEMVSNILSAPIQPLTALRDDVSPELDRVIRRALARNPAQRPETALAFAAALEDCSKTGTASPRVVGAWVSDLAGPILEDRQRCIREIESFAGHTSTPDAREQIGLAQKAAAESRLSAPALTPAFPSTPPVGSSPAEVQQELSQPDSSVLTTTVLRSPAQASSFPKPRESLASNLYASANSVSPRTRSRSITTVALGAIIAVGAIALWFALRTSPAFPTRPVVTEQTSAAAVSPGPSAPGSSQEQAPVPSAPTAQASGRMGADTATATVPTDSTSAKSRHTDTTAGSSTRPPSHSKSRVQNPGQPPEIRPAAP